MHTAEFKLWNTFRKAYVPWFTMKNVSYQEINQECRMATDTVCNLEEWFPDKAKKYFTGYSCFVDGREYHAAHMPSDEEVSG